MTTSDYIDGTDLEQIGKPVEGEEEKSLAQLVTEWVDRTDGAYFDVRQIYQDLKVDSRAGRKNVSVIFQRLKQNEVVKPHATKHGYFKRLMTDVGDIDWRDADVENIVQLSWVFGLERYVNIYPKNICVIAGSFNAGKSAYMLNLVHDNMLFHDVVYFSSEMGAEELKLRLSKFSCGIEEWDFKARERADNFGDVIVPNAINLIDYLEVTNDFYRVAEEMTEIFSRLDKGIAIIALQKKKGAEMGRGAEFSAEKPRLYLSMDSGKLKIIKAKNWRDPENNPNGKEFAFRLRDGCQFELINEI